jgi:hypothetical protein
MMMMMMMVVVVMMMVVIMVLIMMLLECCLTIITIIIICITSTVTINHSYALNSANTSHHHSADIADVSVEASSFLITRKIRIIDIT